MSFRVVTCYENFQVLQVFRSEFFLSWIFWSTIVQTPLFVDFRVAISSILVETILFKFDQNPHFHDFQCPSVPHVCGILQNAITVHHLVGKQQLCIFWCWRIGQFSCLGLVYGFLIVNLDFVCKGIDTQCCNYVYNQFLNWNYLGGGAWCTLKFPSFLGGLNFLK